MKVHKNHHQEVKIFKTIRENFPNERLGIHLSDLLHPLRAYYAKRFPRKPTDNELLYFLAGQAHESVILEWLGVGHTEPEEWNGVFFTPDATIGGIPWEIKTRRRFSATEENVVVEYKSYLSQLRSYCAMIGIPRGYLLVFTLTDKADDFTTKPSLAIWEVNFDEEELAETREHILMQKEKFIYAMSNNDPSSLEPCAEWMCGRTMKKLIKQAECHTCGMKMHVRSINKHLREYPECTEGVAMPEYATTIIATCRWWDVCKEKEEKTA